MRWRRSFQTGGRSAERGARVPGLSCSPLSKGTRAVPVLRDVYVDDAAFDLHRKASHLAAYRLRREKKG